MEKMKDFIIDQLSGFLAEDPFYVPALSNASALLWESVEDINWAGFYLVRKGVLVLGPFQGKPACIHIGYGKGVCGTAWEKDTALVVEDVHAFPGHIACDAASRSEIVVPIHRDGSVAAVLDIDSPQPSRFGEQDKMLFEAFVSVLEKHIVWE